jgi:hypothetical protein
MALTAPTASAPTSAGTAETMRSYPAGHGGSFHAKGKRLLALAPAGGTGGDAWAFGMLLYEMATGIPPLSELPPGARKRL